MAIPKNSHSHQFSSYHSEENNNFENSFVNNKRQNVLFSISLIVLISIILVSFFSFSSHVVQTLKESTQKQLIEVTMQGRNLLQNNFDSLVSSVKTLSNCVATYDDLSGENVNALLKKESSRLNFLRITATKNNNKPIDDIVDDTTAFTQALNGYPSISEPIYSESDKKEVIVVCVPIIKGSGNIGVLSAVCNVKVLENAFSISAFESNCYTYVISSDGDVILRPQNPLSEPNVKNIFATLTEEYNNDISATITDIASRKSGTFSYKKNQAEEKFVAYAPIDHFNGWYMMSFLSADPILKQSNYLISLTCLLLLIVTIVISIIYIYIYLLKRKSRKTFEYLAYTDNLTGCRSWPKFVIDIEEILKKSKDKKHAYVYLNIKNFKFINDIMGFAFGNELLKHISHSFETVTNTNEVFTRVNADRFCCLFEYTNDKMIIDKLENLDEKIQDYKKAHHMDFPLNTLFGIYKIIDKTLPAITMSDRALLALQTLSPTSECNYGFYNGSIRQHALMEKELENDMQTALDNKNFLVFLQPKFSLETNKIVGAESLVRWLHPQRGLIPPSEFIALFEQNGFITKLDYYMFDETCKLLRRWIDDGKEPLPISVNISRVHLYNPNLAEELYCTALRYNIPTNLIEVELTETMDFNNLSILFGIVERLRRFDFIISIDDFGSGYSSLSMLKDLPVNVIKIDREFLSEAADEKRGRKVIESIIDMAKKLDMKTVAEGVENLEQLEFLKSVNCDYVQGYYFSKPIPVKDFQTKYIYIDSNDLSSDYVK